MKTKKQVAAFIKKIERINRASALAWERGNNSGDPRKLEAGERESVRLAGEVERLVAPLGIRVDWPGLYPFYLVNGFAEHGAEAAVLAALGKPRDWLR